MEGPWESLLKMLVINILYLDLSVDYMGIFTYKNSLSSKDKNYCIYVTYQSFLHCPFFHFTVHQGYFVSDQCWSGGLIFENYWSWDKIRIHALGRKFLHNLVQVLFLSAPPASFPPFPCFVYSWCSPQTQKAFYISLPLAICSSSTTYPFSFPAPPGKFSENKFSWVPRETYLMLCSCITFYSKSLR